MKLARLVAGDKALKRATLATVVALVFLIGTGGWVRLSGSGLGCPTWPKCTAKDLAAGANYHALVEFANRCVITAVGVLVAYTVISLYVRREPRSGVRLLAWGLIAGYVGEAVLGGVTVLLKLAPELVAAHLVLAMMLLGDAVVLHWRISAQASSSVRPEVVIMARALLVVLSGSVVAGTIATGSGPYSGAPDTERLHLRFSAVVELHAVIGIFLFGLVVGCFLLLRATAAPRAVWRAYGAVLAAVVCQGLIGYVQYFSGLPTGLVETHIIGAALVVVAVVRLNLQVFSRRRVAALVVAEEEGERKLHAVRAG